MNGLTDTHLRYFVHEDCAGVSAFVNSPGAKQERNARFLAVGALVPLSLGRLGKAWRHAQNLKRLARWVGRHVSFWMAELIAFWI